MRWESLAEEITRLRERAEYAAAAQSRRRSTAQRSRLEHAKVAEARRVKSGARPIVPAGVAAGGDAARREQRLSLSHDDDDLKPCGLIAALL